MNWAGSASATGAAITPGAAGAEWARPHASAAPNAATVTGRNINLRTTPPARSCRTSELCSIGGKKHVENIFARHRARRNRGSGSRRKAGHRQFAHLRRPPRKRAVRLRLVADRPQRSARRAHLHGDAGEGIEHGRRHPGEIGAGKRLRPGRERLAPGAAVGGSLFGRTLEQERGAYPRLPRRRAAQPIVGRRCVLGTTGKTFFRSLDHAALAALAADEREDHGTRYRYRFEPALGRAEITAGLEHLAQQ